MQNRVYAIDIVKKEGQEITLLGWVHARRDHGKLVFIDLRDRSGIAQVVLGSSIKNANDLRLEYVVKVTGEVKKRPPAMANEKTPTGHYEVSAKTLEIMSASEATPIPIDSDGYDVDEEVRMKYRYLDLRRERMQRNLRVRHEVARFIRNYLIEKGFWEVDTPILTKSTPEGARDFLVPSRLQHGKFYALPQSPQQYKQLLMIAGVEKYFQIARCFRDEDPRADRAYGEFTQLDMEMSFVMQEDILVLTEDLFTKLCAAVFPEKKIMQTPWPRLTHKEAKAKYGNDKPDLRKDKSNPNELAFCWVLDFPLFTEQTKEDFFHGSGAAKFAPSHHMFTAPHPDDVPFLDTDPMKVRGLQHDMVLNGFEVGGGSVRIHEAKIQEKIFDLIGFSKEQKEQFSYFLNAFAYGAPPHGGIAPGFDRFIYAALGEKSVREVIPFPASAGGYTSVMTAPSEVERSQLDELGIEIKKQKNKK
ncbi:MAG: aspartate--tRNA ligase [Candidatus Liptonbacteria bacterium]|nr:aspartate--tRNA ligase [Candidatus Liptonbacteria bacterium]